MNLEMERQHRQVSVETVFGTVEGTLRCSALVRTLDEVNQPSSSYVVVHEPADPGTGVAPENASPLAIQKEAIRFIREKRSVPRSHGRAEASHYWRASVELRVGPYMVRGIVHVVPGGDPLSRLNQRAHTFMAVTSARVSGPEGSFEAPFLAINRQHILSAREVDGVEADGEHGGREVVGEWNEGVGP